jgi:hypothetical protein
VSLEDHSKGRREYTVMEEKEKGKERKKGVKSEKKREKG